jgi:hypothetical protein
VPPQPEPQPDSPQYIPQEEDSFGIVVMVLTGEDTQEAQQLPQNNKSATMRRKRSRRRKKAMRRKMMRTTLI